MDRIRSCTKIFPYISRKSEYNWLEYADELKVFPINTNCPCKFVRQIQNNHSMCDAPDCISSHILFFGRTDHQGLPGMMKQLGFINSTSFSILTPIDDFLIHIFKLR